MEKIMEAKKLKSILLVDDDEIYNHIFTLSVDAIDPDIRLHIEKGTDKAINYLASLKLNDQDFPDLILVDINMPLKDGYEFMKLFEQHFSSIYKDTLLYMMTSSIIMDDKLKATQFTSINGFKVKGDVVATLKEIIEEGFTV
ncbi:MAG: hypothetical protein CMO01_09955 [Thalassobius sp.]|nr:hypothetical protein [Thalassovita sp.]